MQHMNHLLISNSTMHGRGYLDHVEEELRDFLRGARRVAFAPFALADRAVYLEKARVRLAAMGLQLESLDADSLRRADAIFVGGGNTFRLLKTLQDLGLADAIAGSGLPYVGSSA